MKTGLIDYGRGNLHSVEKALTKVGCDVERVRSADGFASREVMVLPGVGAFGDAMSALRMQGLEDPLYRWLEQGRPFLGICLGYQLLFRSSEESPGVDGLGWLPGRVVRFPASVGKIPHMGWNRVDFRPGCVFSPEGGAADFYHVHSFYPEGLDEADVACRTMYGGLSFASGMCRGAVAAFQFHPEKSQGAGLGLLASYFESLGSAALAPR